MKHILIILVAILSATNGLAQKVNRAELQHQLKIMDSLLKEKDTLLAVYRNDSLSLAQKLKLCRDSLAVYDFFNTADTSMFSKKTLETNGKATELSGRNKENYETIQKIRKVQTILKEIAEKISNAHEKRKEKLWTEAQLKDYISLEIQADLYAIGDALDVIDKRNLSFLSKDQLTYYRKLSKEFDDLYNQYL